MTWKPSIGAWPENDGVRFSVWTAASQAVEVEVIDSGGSPRLFPMQPGQDGMFAAHVAGISPGTCYRYRLNGRQSFPDVASRFQPEGVHGPSQIIDAAAFRWSDRNWKGIDVRDAVVYELHVGTFTPEGTFEGVRKHLPALRELGVTAVELMPLGDFPGERNWGYDGVSLFAPARCYGHPDDLRRLVAAAHAQGLAVFLDVVYNHLGPDGNYLGAFSPFYFTDRHQTPWGPAINFDGEHSRPVREFFIENALYWLHEFHIDGLRLDATHAIVDDSPRHFLAELSDRVHESFVASTRRPLLIAEDSRNLARMMKPTEQDGLGMDGLGMDAVWADDFHHQIRAALAGDRDGYFQDYTGSTDDIAATICKGWFYCGRKSVFLDRPRGSDPAGLSPAQFVICLQNHDQVGNRAFGGRLHHAIDLAAYRAASVLLLCSPQTPLLFMGQEWAASSPFQFFTDHHESLGKLVTAGRRREFQRFKAFSDPKTRQAIPDPQAVETFVNSHLKWDERDADSHAATLRLYQALLHLRQTEPALGARPPGDSSPLPPDFISRAAQAQAFGDSAVLVRRSAPASGDSEGQDGDLLIAVQLAGPGTIDLRRAPLATLRSGLGWKLLLATEGLQYAVDPRPIRIRGEESAPRIIFLRPGAVVLKAAPPGAAESQPS
jgi:maltooligosyltrehalose trehalohydrolase